MLKVKFRFRPGHRDSLIPAPPWLLKSLFLHLTDTCNLSCGYCHADCGPTGDMPIDLAARIIEDAAQFSRPAIVLTGGEPFCYPNLRELLALCNRFGLSCKIATNGTMLDAERVAMLIEYGVTSLQVSLDTLDPGLYSRVKGVSRTFHQDAIDGIRRCRDSSRLRVVVAAVAEPPAVAGLGDLMEFCHDEEVATFTVYRVIPFGRAAARGAPRLPEDEFRGAVNELMHRFEALPNHFAVDFGIPVAVGSPFLNSWGRRLDVRPIGCIAGKTSMTVLQDGTAVPCVCTRDASQSCGNLRWAGLSDVWNSPVLDVYRGIKTMPGCRECASLASCLGGCHALVGLGCGGLDGRDPTCDVWRSEKWAAVVP